MPKAAEPRKLRRDGLADEESDMLAFRMTSWENGDHAELAEELGARDGCRAVTHGAMLEGDRAVAHHEDPIGQRDGFVDIVGDEQDAGLMIGHQLADQLVHADTGERIERGKRLVEQQKLGLLHQRAGEGNALGLPAGQIARPVVEPVAEADLGERFGGAFARIRSLQAERHIAPEIVPRQQPMLLKHHGRPAGRHDTAPWMGSSPASARNNVVLPHPLSPSRATNSPRSMRRFSFSITTRLP